MNKIVSFFILATLASCGPELELDQGVPQQQGNNKCIRWDGEVVFNGKIGPIVTDMGEVTTMCDGEGIVEAGGTSGGTGGSGGSEGAGGNVPNYLSTPESPVFVENCSYVSKCSGYDTVKQCKKQKYYTECKFDKSLFNTCKQQCKNNKKDCGHHGHGNKHCELDCAKNSKVCVNKQKCLSYKYEQVCSSYKQVVECR